MSFRTPSNSSVSLESPEVMHRDMRRRDDSIFPLKPHQSQILRNYIEEYEDSEDVAFQLPTGGGKTLIGIAISEWRRRKYNERVVYLCPTRQLVHQVVEQSRESYCASPNSFVGPKTKFSQEKKGDYLASDSIAVTTYSSLFNTNPFFDDPHTIVLDDIHAAEEYISSLWTVQILYNKHTELYEDLVNAIRHVIPPTDARKLAGQETSFSDNQWMSKLSTPDFAEIRATVHEIINNQVQGTGQEYAWSYIRDHLRGCHMYVSPQEIMIRPYIPPTNQHSPFSDANQRIYMSATLGSGGDLERITGRQNISRMSPPPDWQKQGIGRRFFFFPGRSLDEESQLDVVFRSHEDVDEVKRSLFLVPSTTNEEAWSEIIEDELKYDTFSASEIEESKEPFTNSEEAVAVVANRYDGIDFPGDDCRFIVLWDLPRAVHLQERFVIEKMGAVTTLQDRITTRIVQAFGRCTREDTDYAAILVAGGKIDEYLLKPDKREFFHPEIQAELAFGIEESRGRTVDEFIELLNIFFERGDAWNEADGQITDLRENCEQREFSGRDDLEDAVEYEIDYQKALWREDYTSAHDACRDVLATLDHSELRGYRALWHYFAGSAAWLAAQNGFPSLESNALKQFEQASQAGENLPWLSRITSGIDADEAPEQSHSSLTPTLIERMEERLLRKGLMNNDKFERQSDRIWSKLSRDDSDSFEDGHKKLGELLGFDSGNMESDGAPDPWWVVNSDLVFVFEDYTETDSDQSVHTNKARQAGGHPNWIRDHLPLREDAKVIPILVTPASSVDEGAIPHLESVFVWPIDEFREWAWDAIETIKELRRTLSGPADSVWRSRAVDAYRANSIDPDSILEFLSQRKALDFLDTPSSSID